MSPDWDKAHFYEKKEEPEAPAAKPEAPAAPSNELKAGEIDAKDLKIVSSISESDLLAAMERRDTIEEELARLEKSAHCHHHHHHCGCTRWHEAAVQGRFQHRPDHHCWYGPLRLDRPAC